MTAEHLEPGKRDPEARRRAILRAAAEIIVTTGPSSLTHRKVASHAGVSLGSTTQYFSSIDELREEALHELAQETDDALAALEPHIKAIPTNPEGAVGEILSFLEDPRSVNTEIALLSSATTDPRLRELALRWTDRLIEMLSEHFDHDRAEAIAVYIDGATIHAGLRQRPLSRAAITLAITALAGGADPHATPTPTTSESEETSA